MIGKHYLMSEVGRHRIKRQYTVANCMGREVYASYLRLLKDPTSKPQPRDKGRFWVTVKDYKRGLSKTLHSGGTRFEVQGPMGKGLGFKREGVHVAFTAGTGCLVFVDLVAHLLRKNLKLLTAEEDQQLSSDFKFIFYVSFPTIKEALALELCQGLADLNKERGFKNFEFRPRFSSESGHWDTAFLKKELETLSPRKIWICGPPTMNETFDRYLTEELKPAFEFEIL